MNLDQIIAKRLAKSSLEENFCPSNLNNVLLTIVKEFTQGSKEFQELQAIRNLVNAIYFIQMDQRPDYLKKLDLSLISPLIDVIGNDLLLAAISHAKWLISKDHESCVTAVKHYIKIVEIVEKNQIGEFYLLNIKNYLFEASNLAKILNNEKLKTEIKNLAWELLNKNSQKIECFFQLWMIEVILSLDKNCGNKLIQILWKIIDLNINSKSNPKYIKRYYVQLIKILQKNINIDEISKAKIKIANYYIEYTNEIIQNNINKIRGNWALIDEFLVDAKEIYTELDDQDRRRKCESLISQAQQHFRNNGKEIDFKFILHDSIVNVELIVNNLADKEIYDWFLEFIKADVFQFLSIEEYKNASNQANSNSLIHIVNPDVQLHENEKIADIIDTQTLSLNQYLNIIHVLKHVSLQKYKERIHEKFGNDEIQSVMHYIAYNNPIITQEYQKQVLTALYYGWFDEDGIISTNLIGPIIEKILRQIVKNEGGYSLKGKRGNTVAQNDLTFEDLCRDHRETITKNKLINKNIFENLEYLMIKPGFKLRHRAAHGLFSDADYSQPHHKIAWLLFLQFLLYPLIYSTCVETI